MALSPEQRKQLLDDLYKQYVTTEDILGLEERLGSILKEQNKSLSNYLASQKEIERRVKEQAKATKSLEELQAKITSLADLEKQVRDEEKPIIQAKIKALADIVAQTEKSLHLNQQEIDALSQNLNITKVIGNELKKGAESLYKQYFYYTDIWDYLQQVDKGIRSVQLNLGLSGNKAQFMREQMYEAVNTAQRFGASIDDVVQLQTTVNQLTGRANVFTENQIANMVLIAKGTGMANEEASQLVGNMLLLGSSVEDATSFIEGTVNETAKLGLTSSNVVKGIASNIESLNKYRFQNGVEGLKKMVQSSEKFKFSMEGAFAAAEKFRTLEGLLEAGATMRVLGGEFAKMDEFKLSFLARNKPEEFAVEMAKLTKGMATFNKTTGEFDISDVDFDKLRVVADATGRSVDDLAKQTREFNKQQFAKKQIFIGTDEEKEMLAKLATFGKGSTIGMIQIGDKNVKLSELTREQLDLYKQQQKTLQERAIDSQNFNETFNNTIMQVKSTLLPLLEVINSVLEGFNKVFNLARDENGKMSKLAAIIPIGGLLLGTVGGSAVMALLRGLSSLAASGVGKLFGKLGGTLGGGGGGAGGIGLMGASLKTLTGVGIAAIGIGAGMFIAAKGVASLAEAFAKLNTNQLIGINAALITMGATMGAIAYFAPVLGAAAPEVALFAGAVALLGGAVAIAGAGIGEMFKGIASMWNTENVNFTGLEALGNVDFNNMDKLNVLKSFTEKDVNRMNEMFDVLNKINSIDTSKLNAIEKLFSNTTLKVQLEGNPMINNNITVEVDGEKFYKRVEKMIPIVVKKGVMPK